MSCNSLTDTLMWYAKLSQFIVHIQHVSFFGYFDVHLNYLIYVFSWLFMSANHIYQFNYSITVRYSQAHHASFNHLFESPKEQTEHMHQKLNCHALSSEISFSFAMFYVPMTQHLIYVQQLKAQHAMDVANLYNLWGKKIF